METGTGALCYGDAAARPSAVRGIRLASSRRKTMYQADIFGVGGSPARSKPARPEIVADVFSLPPRNAGSWRSGDGVG